MKKSKLLLSLLVLGGAIWLSREAILTSLARYLVEAEEAQPAEIAIVLGGDSEGNRANMGCELLKKGLVKQIWFSGSQSMYGRTESELAREWAAARGCDVTKMVALRGMVDSTADEARGITAKMRQAGIRDFILVTSNYHTRRAGGLFRKFGTDMKVTVVAAADHDFPVDKWWKYRPTRKTFAFEWMKTITSWLGV